MSVDPRDVSPVVNVLLEAIAIDQPDEGQPRSDLVFLLSKEEGRDDHPPR